MLIVSQNKDTIMNFDNIEILGIGNPLEDDDGKFKILANTTSDSQYTLAKYDTEERAKEILKEMVKEYENVKAIFDCTTRRIKNYINKPKVYKMPKE